MEIEVQMARQGDKSVHDFYNLMTSFWDQLALMDPPELNKLDIYHTNRDEQQLVQFLMALRDEFEAIRGSILHRSPLSELIVKEIANSFAISSISSGFVISSVSSGYPVYLCSSYYSTNTVCTELSTNYKGCN